MERAKNVLAVLIIVLFVGILILGPVYKLVRMNVQTTELAEMNEHIIEIYNRLVDVNRNTSQVHSDYMRVNHYISGHDFRHPTDYCPECGLLKELEKREVELDTRIMVLADELEELKQSGLQDSPEFKVKAEEINRCTIEEMSLNKHLHSADQRAIEVNKVMRDKRLVGNKGFVPNQEKK